MVESARVDGVLERLAPLAHEFVLIGSQAVQYWTKHYMARVPELQQNAPYSTKDVDFCGTAAQARECARLLGGTCQEFTPDDRSPCSAIIDLGDLQIDFLRVPFGIKDAQQLRTQSVVYAYGRVMHPMHMLESRAANVAELPNYQSERSLKQLRAAILCMRELIVDTLERSANDPRAVRSALGMSERVFKLAESDVGVKAHLVHEHDVLDALVLDSRMPEAFLSYRVPQARARVESKRLDLQRGMEKAARKGRDLAAVAKSPEMARRQRGYKR